MALLGGEDRGEMKYCWLFPVSIMPFLPSYQQKKISGRKKEKMVRKEKEELGYIPYGECLSCEIICPLKLALSKLVEIKCFV